MIEISTSNLYILMPALWACFIIYIIWYATKAKHYSTITLLEAKQLWTIHRQDTQCNGRKWRQIKRTGKTIGFQCECGHRHIQRRPIVAHLPTATMEYDVSAFDRLHTTHKSA